MKAMIPALLMLSLAGCTLSNAPEPLDTREAASLAKALDGKVAGASVSCVSTIGGRNLRAIGDHTMIYEVSRKLVYRNDLLGACRGLGMGDTLVLRVTGSQYCRGDIAHVVNLQTGMLSGSCALGDFVPYTAAPSGSRPAGGGK